MKTTPVEFFSEGVRLHGLLRTPDCDAEDALPAIVQGPGWLGLADSKSYESWHRGFTDAGYAVLAFDYRGFGSSEGERGWVVPEWQLQDILNAVTYLQIRPDIDGNRIGIYGMGGTGGGNAILAAAVDDRIRCVISQSAVADGRDWLHRMRREYEWVEYLQRLEADNSRWVSEGTGEKVDPRLDLMVATPERKQVNHKGDVDHRIEPTFYLRSARHILQYRPLDVVHRIAPRALLLTSVVNDVVTPEDHATMLYSVAGSPKKLIRQSETTHYRSYTDNYSVLMAEFVDWYDRHLKYSPISAVQETPVAESSFLHSAAADGNRQPSRTVAVAAATAGSK